MSRPHSDLHFLTEDIIARNSVYWVFGVIQFAMALKIFERLQAIPVERPRIITLGVDYYICSNGNYLELRIVGCSGLLRTGRVIVDDQVLHPNVYRINPYIVDGPIRILSPNGRITIEERGKFFLVTNTIRGGITKYSKGEEYEFGKVLVRRID